MGHQKGVYLALLTALISGASVFVNGFVVKGFDPFVFTTLKNVAVVALLFAGLVLWREQKELLKLNKAQLAKLIAIGAVGGSVPFLLFFWGLSLSSGAVGSFFYRLLFIFASVMAFVFLKERLNRNFLIGGALALAGNILLLKGELGFGFPELLVVLATVLWAIEFNISKVALADIRPRVVAFGRMFFGSLILLAFLAVTGKASLIAGLTEVHWEWVAITSIFLFTYLLAWYPALAKLPVSVATPVLALGGPVTAFLSLTLTGKALAPLEAISMLLIAAGIAIICGLYEAIRSVVSPTVVRT